MGQILEFAPVCSRHKKSMGEGPQCFSTCREEAEAAKAARLVVKPDHVVDQQVVIEPTTKVVPKAERLAQAPGASTDQPALRRGRGAGRRFTKVTAAGAAVARAQALAPERRQAIARRAASARWGKS